jgi:hypothetical protein
VYASGYAGNVYRYPGGNPGARTVLTNVGGGTHCPLAFDPRQTMLYAGSGANGALYVVNPDTGALTLVATGLGPITAMTVIGNVGFPGHINEFGQGLAGAGGIVPALHGQGHASPGGTITLGIRDFVGGAQGALMFGLAKGNQNGFGGKIYVSFAAPFFFITLGLPGTPGVPGAGDLDITSYIPNSPLLGGLSLYFQHLARDTAAVQDVALTNGLEVFIGD